MCCVAGTLAGHTHCHCQVACSCNHKYALSCAPDLSFVLAKQDGISSLKLHATVLKTSNRRSQQEGSAAGSRGQPSQRAPFDARQLLAQLGSYDAGQQVLQAVHISQVGSVDDSTGHYLQLARLDLLQGHG